MKESPRPSTESIFNHEIIMDFLSYTAFTAAISIVAYAVPLYTQGHHRIEGADCDSDFNFTNCYSLYRARATLLVTLRAFSSLILMAHCRSYRIIDWGPRGLRQSMKSRTAVLTFLFDLVGLCIFMYTPIVAVKGFFMYQVTWEWVSLWVSVFYLSLTVNFTKSTCGRLKLMSLVNLLAWNDNN